jgi:hypothetical protein
MSLRARRRAQASAASTSARTCPRRARSSARTFATTFVRAHPVAGRCECRRRRGLRTVRGLKAASADPIARAETGLDIEQHRRRVELVVSESADRPRSVENATRSPRA